MQNPTNPPSFVPPPVSKDGEQRTSERPPGTTLENKQGVYAKRVHAARVPSSSSLSSRRPAAAGIAAAASASASAAAAAFAAAAENH